VAIVAIAVGGCSSTKDFIKPDQKTIDGYIESHPDLPELDKACIYEGRFEIGMRKETVQFLLGEPKEVTQVSQPWAVQDKWMYKLGREKKVFYIEDDGVVGIEEND
jgi:hypothetical protein